MGIYKWKQENTLSTKKAIKKKRKKTRSRQRKKKNFPFSSYFLVFFYKFSPKDGRIDCRGCFLNASVLSFGRPRPQLTTLYCIPLFLFWIYKGKLQNTYFRFFLTFCHFYFIFFSEVIMGRKKIRDKPAAAPTATRKSGSRKVSSSSSSTHTSQENLFEQVCIWILYFLGSI